MIALLLTVSLGGAPDMLVYQTGTLQHVFIQPERAKYETKSEAYSRTGCWCEMCQRLGWSGYRETGKILINGVTPMDKLEAVLRNVQLKASDRVCDAGCGDGRFVILAAKEFGSKGVGLDTRQDAIAIAEANARRNGVTAKFRPWDALEVDYSLVSVVFAHLPPNVTKQLTPVLRQYRSNLRAAISYAHPWGVNGEEEIGGFYVWRFAKKRSARRGSDEYLAPVADEGSSTITPERPEPRQYVVRAWGASWCTSCKSKQWQDTLDRLGELPNVTLKRMQFDDHKSYCFENGITTLPAVQVMTPDESEQVSLRSGVLSFEQLRSILDGKQDPDNANQVRNASYSRGGS